MSRSRLRKTWDRLPAIPTTTLPSPHRFVLLCLAEDAAPGPAAIAARTGLSSHTVAACLADLENAGWIRGERRSEPRERGEQRLPTTWILAGDGGPVVRARPGRHLARKGPLRGGVPGRVRGGVGIERSGAVSEVRLKSAPERAIGSAGLFDEAGFEATPDRLAVTRLTLRPTDAAGWELWRTMVSAPLLRGAEEADRMVKPGSLARQAAGLARRLAVEHLAVDAGRRLITELVAALAAERADAGPGWAPPTMASMSQRLHALLGEHAGTLRALVPAGAQPPKGAA